MSSAYSQPIPRCPDGKTYNSPCRCEFCTHQKMLRMKEYRLRRLKTEAGAVFPHTLIDVKPVRTQLRRAVHSGNVTLHQMSIWMGLGRLAIHQIYAGKTSRIKSKNAEKMDYILKNLDEFKAEDSALVPYDRTRQIILSLCAQGWTIEHQRELLRRYKNINGGFMLSVTSGQWKRTKKINEDHVVWLAKTIGDKTGPSKRLPAQMATRGIFPNKHYDGTGELIVTSLSAEQRKRVL